MEEARGTLIEVIESQDPLMKFKQMVPWPIVIADFALMLVFVTCLSYLPGF